MDASVVLAIVLDEPEKSGIVSVTRGTVLLAPGCLSWEIGNAFSAMLKRNRLTKAEVLKGLEVYAKIPVQSLNVNWKMALQLCDKHNIYAYDAYYLEVAIRGLVPLLTLDSRMAQVADIEGIKLREIV